MNRIRRVVEPIRRCPSLTGRHTIAAISAAAGRHTITAATTAAARRHTIIAAAAAAMAGKFTITGRHTAAAAGWQTTTSAGGILLQLQTRISVSPFPHEEMLHPALCQNQPPQPPVEACNRPVMVFQHPFTMMIPGPTGIYFSFHFCFVKTCKYKH